MTFPYKIKPLSTAAFFLLFTAIILVYSIVRPEKVSMFSRSQTYQDKSRSPVTGVAVLRETKMLKPTDNIIVRIMVNYQAVAKANTQVTSKILRTEGRTIDGMVKAEWAVENRMTQLIYFGGALVIAW